MAQLLGATCVFEVDLKAVLQNFGVLRMQNAQDARRIVSPYADMKNGGADLENRDVENRLRVRW